MLCRKYLFIHGPFSIAILVNQSVTCLHQVLILQIATKPHMYPTRLAPTTNGLINGLARGYNL